MAITPDQQLAMEIHLRRMWTGSVEQFVFDLTDDELLRIESDPTFLTRQRDRYGFPGLDKLESAAKRELEWRQENGLHYGWTAV